jgi:hypothetical protein
VILISTNKSVVLLLCQAKKAAAAAARAILPASIAPASASNGVEAGEDDEPESSIAHESSGKSAAKEASSSRNKKTTDETRLMSAVFMLAVFSENSESKNGTSALVITILSNHSNASNWQVSNIPNGLPWRCHLTTNHHVMKTPEEARRYKAYQVSRDNILVHYDLDPGEHLSMHICNIHTYMNT